MSSRLSSFGARIDKLFSITFSEGGCAALLGGAEGGGDGTDCCLEQGERLY